MHKKDFTIEKLVHNSSFRRMAAGTATDDEIRSWNSWIEENKTNREKASEALSQIAGFAFKDPKQPDIEAEWNRLYKHTIGSPTIKNSAASKPSTSLQWIYRIAAILIIGAFVGIGVYQYSPNGKALEKVEQITERQTIKAGSNEQKTITFSDGSKITLNNNSTMTYTVGLLHAQTIEVVLEGEAYFDAKSNPGQSYPQFTIQTPDGIIRDIGTAFLVTVQEDWSSIVVQEGKVDVQLKNKKENDKNILILKGEKLEFNRTTILSKQAVNTTFYTSWATGFIDFDQTTIREFADFVEQRFKVQVKITPTPLGDVKMGGSIYFESLAELVRSVSNVANASAYQSGDGNTVYITAKEPPVAD